MTRRDAEALLKQTNGNICLYRRADGTVLTEDCPVGFSVKVTHARRRIGWVAAGALSFASAFAQDAASLSGKVMDASGAVVPRAKITITDPKTGNAMQLQSDEGGRFAESPLPPGSYTIKVLVPGFNEFEHPDTVVKASQQAKLDITLQVANAIVGAIEMAVEPDSVLHKANLPPKPDDSAAKRKPWWRRLL
jgi:hypothetical protein